MGKFGKGILGAFTGKVGTVIGSSWRGIHYMRSLPVFKKNRQPSDLQLEQQMRFGMMTRFLTPVRLLLEEGFKNYAVRQTAYNSALSYNVKNGITGAYPALSLDYTMVLISRGDLPAAQAPAVSSTAANTVTFSWTDNSGQGKAKATDEVMLMAYCPTLDKAVFRIGGANRSEAVADLELPPAFTGSTVHTWIAFRSIEGKEISASVYTATVIVS